LAMAVELLMPPLAAHGASVLVGSGAVVEEAQVGGSPVRVLVATLRHATLPRSMAEDALVVQALFGNSREAGVGSWPLTAEVRGAAAEEDAFGGKAKVDLGAAVTFPWHCGVDPTLRLRLTQPPLRSAVADVLLEVPLCDAGAGERVSRDVPMPLRCLGGRWSTGSVALDLEVRFVSPMQLGELLSTPADLANRAPSPDILREVEMTVPLSLAAPPLKGEGASCGAAQPGAPRASPAPAQLPVLLRRRPATGPEEPKD